MFGRRLTKIAFPPVTSQGNKRTYSVHNPEPVNVLYSAKQLQHNLACCALRKRTSGHQVLEELSATSQLHNEVIFIEGRVRVVQFENVMVTHFLENLNE